MNFDRSVAGRLKSMVLISHGTMDERRAFKQAEVLRDELDRLHKPYEWLPLRGEEHGCHSNDNQIRFLRKTIGTIAGEMTRRK